MTNSVSVWRHIAIAVAVGLFLECASAAEPAHLLRDFDRIQIVIATSRQRCTVIDVYVADKPVLRRNGLMFVESMDLYEGMLFISGAPEEISMWMKNTILPLDMLFFDSDWRISHIHRNAVPFSEATISSNGRALGVIELNGGAAEQLGIATGDQIILPGPGN